jgi:hypothetical protein
MKKEIALDIANKACSEFEDGETGLFSCIELYLEENNLPYDAEDIERIFLQEEAISHGIPRSVVKGKSKLSNHFSQEYINHQCNR